MPAFSVSAPSLRSLKNVVLDIQPSLKSSHLTEALAYAFGFTTNAALLAQLAKSGGSWVASVNEQRFAERLRDLGYTSIPSVPLSAIAAGASQPEPFKSWLGQINVLLAQSPTHWPAVYALRDRCASWFGDYWNLGQPAPQEDDNRTVLRLERGVDHAFAQAKWPTTVRASGPALNFPGTDHQVRFYSNLPLSNGRHVAYSTALASMPYVDSSFNLDKLPEARAIAETVGWECVELPGWSWYAPQDTTLVLFRRKTSHSEVLRTWKNSFKRWLIENKSRLIKGAQLPRRQVIEDVISDTHFPFAVGSYEELRETYLKHFVETLYLWPDDPLPKALEKLFKRWQTELFAAGGQFAYMDGTAG